MKFFLFFLTTYLVLFVSNANSFQFNPRVTVIGSNTRTKNFSTIYDGKFKIENRKFNFGFEVTHDIVNFNDFILRSGIQYKSYREKTFGLNQIPEVNNLPYPFTWKHSFGALAVPLYISKKWVGTYHAEIYAGGTLGFMYLGEVRQSVDAPQNVDQTKDFFVDRVLVDTFSAAPEFIATLNLGVSFCPIKSLPRFSAGVQLAAQLSKNSQTYYLAQEYVFAREETNNYLAKNQMRVLEFSLLLSYTLGKGVK